MGYFAFWMSLTFAVTAFGWVLMRNRLVRLRSEVELSKETLKTHREARSASAERIAELKLLTSDDAKCDNAIMEIQHAARDVVAAKRFRDLAVSRYNAVILSFPMWLVAAAHGYRTVDLNAELSETVAGASKPQL
jgi:hypothetical protein